MHPVFNLLDLSRTQLQDVSGAIEDNNKALEALLKYYRNRTDYEGFVFAENQTLDSLRQEFKKIPESEKEHILMVSAQLAENTFLFQEPWDMERTQIPYQFEGEIDWQVNPDHDPEWTFMLNRMNYLNVLAQAYLLTNNHQYTQIYMRLVNDWLQKNKGPEGLRYTSWRSIDSAIRLRNWVKSLEIFITDPEFSAELLADMLVSCVVHFEYLQEGWTINRLQTNWVVLEANGAYLASLFFKELKVAAYFESISLPYVTRAALTQETTEGMHWEQSYQYHHEVLLKLAEIYLLGTRNQKLMPKELKDVINRMSLVAAHARKPDGTQDNYGDSDRESVDELLLLLEQITGLTLLDSHAQAGPNRFVLTHFGQFIQQSDGQALYQKSWAFDEAGVYLLKDPTHQFHAQFKCGFLGHGHGHDDLLHLSIFDEGEDLLVDAGRYSYEGEYHQRLSFKSQEYHNTTMVDNLSINEHANCWDAKKVAHQVNSKFRFNEKMDFVEGGHLGYLDLPDPIYTNRKVLYIKPDVLLIVDEFLGRGEHQFTQNLHFKLNQLEKVSTTQLRYTNSKGKKYPITTFISDSEKQAEWKLSQQFVSDDYNEKHLVPKATMTVGSSAPFTMCTFISLGEKELSIEPIEVFNEYESRRKRSTASAFKITEQNRPTTETKYIVVNHYEDADSRRAYIVDGHQVYGRVALVEVQGNKESVTRIY